MTDFVHTKSLFHLPDGVIYLDGNSLGPLPVKAVERVSEVMRDEWGVQLIRGWNQCGWMQQPERVGDRLGALLGAEPGTMVMGDTLSIKVYQALAAALAINPHRKVILSDSGNFPTDLYMAQGMVKSFGGNYELKVVDPSEVVSSLDDSVAVLMLTQVDYRSGRVYPMQQLTRQAHECGAITVWDLAHSAGAIPVDLAGANADFAVGCTYKYLNGGPGAPAFIYVAPRYANSAFPVLSGWLGHDAPFDFDPDYRPAPSVSRMRVGTPPVLALASLEASLDIWEQVNMQDVRNKSVELCELFISEVECRCPQLTLASPRNADERGSQVSFQFEHGYAAMQALIDRNVIGDFRAPDIMRFGFTPLYLGTQDVVAAVDVLETVLRDRLWDNPVYQQRAAVT